MEFKGKVIIVTGASSGIGLAVARRLTDEGATVVLAARDGERLRSVEKELDQSMVMPADVTDADQARSLIGRTVDELGGVDVLSTVPAGRWRGRSSASIWRSTAMCWSSTWSRRCD
jgi:NADP-dependent 3-hydroxy acid dehydrogenase YdfG